MRILDQELQNIIWTYHLSFAAVNRHANLFFYVDFEQVLESVIVLIQARFSYAHYKVKKGL